MLWNSVTKKMLICIVAVCCLRGWILIYMKPIWLLMQEAVEMLSNMNHPAGDCPLCLYPLVKENDGSALPFMKLMSCYHCFHRLTSATYWYVQLQEILCSSVLLFWNFSDCIMRWWEWLQNDDTDSKKSSTAATTEGARNISFCLFFFTSVKCVF